MYAEPQYTSPFIYDDVNVMPNLLAIDSLVMSYQETPRKLKEQHLKSLKVIQNEQMFK